MHNLLIGGWFDNRRVVLTISNFAGKDPVSNANRYDRKNKKNIQIPSPASIQIYNKFMGGLDKADMFFPLYRTKLRTRKWYHRIAIHLIQLDLINSYFIYKEVGGKGSLLCFHVDVWRCLLKSLETSNSDEDLEAPFKVYHSLKTKNVSNQVRHDKFNHWPLKSTINRCKMDGCSSHTTFIYLKCQVYLCVGKGGENCFLEFHGVLWAHLHIYHWNFAFAVDIVTDCLSHENSKFLIPEFLLYT